MPTIDVLIPTCNRLPSLVMTLSGVALQDFTEFQLILADQSDDLVEEDPAVRSLLRLIQARCGSVQVHHRPPLHGIAEQRDFLLRQATAPYVLFLDDDVLMEPWVLGRLLETVQEEGCAFVGAFPAGLSFRNDVRPDQQRIEYWDSQVQPEIVEPGSNEWERWNLHRAANLYHIERNQAPPSVRTYKVAWVGACVLYNREKLLAIGGYSFWPRLPRFHSGEDVLVQNLLMRLWGGCGIIPSGTYFSEASTTVLNEAGKVDGHALELLPEMVARYGPELEAQGESPVKPWQRNGHKS